MIRSDELKAHLALFFVNALYGASHILAKGVMPDYLSPSVFILLRVAGATALFWIVKSLFVKEHIQRRDFFILALCGLFGVAVNQLFFFHGLHLSSSINSGIIMTINPVLVVILSYLLLKQGITWIRLSGILLASVGAILLTLTAGTIHGDSIIGDVFLFINAASYAVYLVIAKPLMSKYRPLTVITWVFTFGMGYVLLYPPALRDLYHTNFHSIPADVWLIIAYVVIGVTFLTYLLTMYGLKHLSPTTSSVYIYLQPVLVIFFAYILLNLGLAEDYTRTITIKKVAYMFLIFIGVYLAGRKK